MQKTKEQHQQHAEAFNAAATRLGGKAQDQPDPVLLGVVNNAKPALTGPAQVVDLAIELEDGAAQTYVANTGAYSNKNARSVAASIMGVEAQHVAILNAVKALVAGRRRRPHRAPARRREVAGRGRERRLPRTRSTRPRTPVRRTKEQCSEASQPQAGCPRDQRGRAHGHDARPRRRPSRLVAVDAGEPRGVDASRAATSATGITRLVSTPSSRRAFLLGGGAVLGGFALVGSGVGSGLAAAATGDRVPAAVPAGAVGAEADR